MDVCVNICGLALYMFYVFVCLALFCDLSMSSDGVSVGGISLRFVCVCGATKGAVRSTRLEP